MRSCQGQSHHAADDTPQLLADLEFCMVEKLPQPALGWRESFGLPFPLCLSSSSSLRILMSPTGPRYRQARCFGLTLVLLVRSHHYYLSKEGRSLYCFDSDLYFGHRRSDDIQHETFDASFAGGFGTISTEGCQYSLPKLNTRFGNGVSLEHLWLS